MLDRRAFLARLGFGTIAAAAAATSAFDLERMLWRPAEKKIFLPTESPRLSIWPGSILRVGDMISIGGDPAIYRVTSVVLGDANNLVNISPVIYQPSTQEWR